MHPRTHLSPAFLLTRMCFNCDVDRMPTSPVLPRHPGLAFGGDYNPEQWPLAVQEEDVELMQRAGVTLATVGVFSWAQLERRPGDFEFGWLDAVLDRLHKGGIHVDLATATASPPPWLAVRHPEMLPVTADGTRLWTGGRQAYCPSSPAYLEHALRLCRRMGERYGDHEAVVLWHVSNEIGNHNTLCYCDVSAAAFRRWLEQKYGDVEALNEAWGTTFWSQRYDSFDEVFPPRTAPTFPNPTQQLDFRRFSSDEHLGLFVAERQVLHEISPGIPVTTNFMVMSHVSGLDYWSWAREVDVVSNDHYLEAADPDGHVELAFSADLTRGLAGGGPWLLMEHSTSAVNWQPRNIAKRPGEMTRNALQHVARGSDAVLFFQWRASRAGAEKFHSALVPHAGTETRLWREVEALGSLLDRLGEVVGSRTRNDVAFIFDWNAWWASELDSHPTTDLTYLDRAHALYRSLWDRGIGVDFVGAEQDLAGYSVVVVPTLYLISDATVARVEEAARGGATVVVTYFSGIVDVNDHIRLGGYPGAFRELLGVWVEEFLPLRRGEVIRLSDGTTADTWTEHVHARGAETVVQCLDGPAAGMPAVTRHRVGEGTAWYVATRLDAAGNAALTEAVLAEAGVKPVARSRPGVEVTRRRSDDASWLFVINHTHAVASVKVTGHDLVADRPVAGTLVLSPGDVAVVRES